ncbi:helix-turn-helix domain-containing protein [Mesorhizobium sp. CAU 1741]|uniref:helix-turn-helix domain-containing protein n=1 Tax=Mesorhizobium sp. CAU 1741 TaxID=3140366 RepID=UPI00325BA7C6
MNVVPSYRLYREKSGESGDFWIHCETIPERTHLHNWHIAQHRHDSFFQIFLLSAGGGEIAEQTGKRSLASPCAIFIPPGAVHGFSYAKDVDGLVVTALADRLQSLVAADRQIAAFCAQTRIVPLSAGDADAAYATDCIHRLHGELAGFASGRMLLLEPLMTGAVVALARAGTGASGDGLDDRDRHRLETLVTMIAANFRTHKPVQFYADAIGLSPTHLNRLARAETGFSVMGLVALQIMEAARRDLVFTPTPVQAIAYSLGFSDPAYFNRFFRRQAGISPGAFREEGRRRMASGDLSGLGQ